MGIARGRTTIVWCCDRTGMFYLHQMNGKHHCDTTTVRKGKRLQLTMDIFEMSGRVCLHKHHRQQMTFGYHISLGEILTTTQCISVLRSKGASVKTLKWEWSCISWYSISLLWYKTHIPNIRLDPYCPHLVAGERLSDVGCLWLSWQMAVLLLMLLSWPKLTRKSSLNWPFFLLFTAHHPQPCCLVWSRFQMWTCTFTHVANNRRWSVSDTLSLLQILCLV